MNFLSNYPFGDTDRETWTDRYGKFDSGSDELTPKGFMYNQVKIADGVYVDVYNLHADADTDPKSEAARRSNLNQLATTSPTFSRPVSVTIRGENRVDAISMTYGDGTVLSNGGTGGTQKTLALEDDEYIIQAVIYKNTYKGSDRVFYLELTTNKNCVLESGVKSGTALTLTAPAGTYIAGFFGRAEANIDKIGAIYKSLE